MDWSVGGDGDGYVTPVSECVKCMEGEFPMHLPTNGRALHRDRLGEQGVQKASPHVQSRILEVEPEIWKVTAKERYKVPQGHSIRNSSGNYHSFLDTRC